MRRLHEGHRPVACRTQRGAQKPKLAHAGLLHQKVYQRPDWPTATRQLGRKHRVAGINKPPTATRKLRRPLQGRVYLFGSNPSGRHAASKNLYIYTVSYAQFCDNGLSLLIGG